jgi:hypothetical protein
MGGSAGRWWLAPRSLKFEKPTGLGLGIFAEALSERGFPVNHGKEKTLAPTSG